MYHIAKVLIKPIYRNTLQSPMVNTGYIGDFLKYA